MADRTDAVGITTGQRSARRIRRNTRQHCRNGITAAAHPGNPIAATSVVGTDWQLANYVAAASTTQRVRTDASVSVVLDRVWLRVVGPNAPARPVGSH